MVLRTFLDLRILGYQIFGDSLLRWIFIWGAPMGCSRELIRLGWYKGLIYGILSPAEISAEGYRCFQQRRAVEIIECRICTVDDVQSVLFRQSGINRSPEKSNSNFQLTMEARQTTFVLSTEDFQHNWNLIFSFCKLLTTLRQRDLQLCNSLQRSRDVDIT